MPVWSSAPCARLAPFVKQVWYFEGADLPEGRERVLPAVGMQLLVNLDRDELGWWEGPGLDRQRRIGGAALGGVQPRAVGIGTAQQRAVAGVAFVPGGARALLSIPAQVLAGHYVPLDELWGRRGAVVRERLLEAARPEAILAELQAVLLELLGVGAPEPAMGTARSHLTRGASVRDVAAHIGLSERRFRDRFAREVGVSPKAFVRIARLERAVALFQGGRYGTWTAVAHAAGYHDQAHMAHDFRDLAGLSPSAYVPRNARDLSHVPLRD